jgi:murein DD-endopeptidase MepM/ murein hydrolase activator NlpD
MLKYFLLIIFCCSGAAVFSQSNLRIFARKEGDNTVLYADNNEVCPVSVQLTLSLDNLAANEAEDRIYIVPASTVNFRLMELIRKKPRGKTSYSYNYTAVYGDARQTTYDHNFVYELPFKKGLSSRVEQGYNGTFSHQGENSIDFNMRIGSEVHAARAGIVIAVVQRFTENCWRDECRQMANYVLIYHNDGTIADYSHLQYNGARVAIGDSVQKGQLIAFSGNTGYTRGPHLHFDCYLPEFENKRTLATKFKTVGGAVFLKEGKVYKN